LFLEEDRTFYKNMSEPSYPGKCHGFVCQPLIIQRKIVTCG
jgi:hypothetical protein